MNLCEFHTQYDGSFGRRKCTTVHHPCYESDKTGTKTVSTDNIGAGSTYLLSRPLTL